MTRYPWLVPAVLTVALLIPARLAAQATPLVGRVVAVADGDTITVLDATKTQHRVRLNGIDAPERGQAYGTRARQALADLVFQEDVRVDWTTRDRYGRLIGTVWVGDRNANLAQLETGLAWFYPQYERDVPVAMRPTYATAEQRARSQRIGLWQDPAPVAPWDYRNPPATASQADGRVIGNKNSGIYHVPGCRDYQRVAERNRVYFDTEAAAVEAGFRKARNCS